MASLYRRPNSSLWWAKFRVNGKVIRVSTGCESKRAAKDFLDVHAGKIAERRPLPVKLDRILWDELRADLAAHYRTTGCVKHLPDAERLLRHLDVAFRGWPAVSITPDKITGYVATRQGEKVPGTERPVSNAQINRELASLRRAMRLAVKHDKLVKVPAITMLKESLPRGGFLEEVDFRTIAGHLAPDAALAATIAYETAWRIQSEVLTLTWDRVNLAEGSIRIDAGQSKNGEARTAFLGPDTARMLAAQRERVVALGRQLARVIPDVFAHTGPGPLQGRRMVEFRKAWRRACTRAGFSGILLHDLRRSGVRSLIRSGVHERVAMTISGHKTRSVFDRYNISSEADLKEAAARRAHFGHTQAAKVMTLAR